jgi:hypothetical protein
MRTGQLKSAWMFVCLTSCVSCDGAADVVQTGKIDNPKITESSGVVASRQYTNVFWTHNDGGKSETLFAIAREGKTLAEFKVLGAKIDDWEDIAIDGERHLYIADTGDNEAKRKRVTVFRVDEPDPSASGGGVRATHKWQLNWPNGAVDCEGLFIDGTNGYLVTKVKNDRRAEVYRFQCSPVESQVLEFLAKLTIDSPVTGADISPNGAAVALVSSTGAFVYRIDGDVSKMAKVLPYHTRFKNDSMEACTFVPDGLLATTEARQVLLFTAEPFRVLR